MTEEKIISIITINYNGLKDTCELMDTLPLDDKSLEVIVVDNASRQANALHHTWLLLLFLSQSRL